MIEAKLPEKKWPFILNRFKGLNVNNITKAPERKEGEEEKISEEIMAKIFTNLCSIDLPYKEN